MDKHIALCKNAIVTALGKPAKDFTKDDIIRYISENGIEMVNFMYPAGDGRLKTLNFVINDLDYLETILSLGERVDGSSLFPFISAGSSDLYVLPRFRTAFVRRTSHADYAVFVLRQGRTATGEFAGAHAAQGMC